MNFDEMRELIEADAFDELEARLKKPLDRKELAAELKKYEREKRVDFGSWRIRAGLAIAGAGVLPNASTLAPWLVRNEPWWNWDGTRSPLDITLDVLRHRDEPWLPDLGARMAARLPTRSIDRSHFRLVAELCGDSPPDTDGFLIQLAEHGPDAFRPAYAPLIPRLLEVIRAQLRSRRWVPFLIANAGRGLLYDSCLARLQQGGTAGEMAGFLDLHAALDPTTDEVSAHARDYVAMLPDSRSPVAQLAQQQLMRVDLDHALRCEASRWVFGRTEKKLVRTQLTWLAQHIDDEALLAVATLFAHPAADLQSRAVSLVRKHFGEVDEDTRREILALADQLPPDLAVQLGGTAAPASEAGLAPFTDPPMPHRIESLDDLTRSVLAMLARNARHVDPVELELVLDAVVRFAWQDREKLIDAMQPVFAKHQWLTVTPVYRGHERRTTSPREEVSRILRAAGTPAHPRGALRDVLRQVREWREELANGRLDGPSETMTRRLHEIAENLVHAPRPMLVSMPTSQSGLIDPAVLAARLRQACAEDWQPWPRDLRQAFDRLPHDVDAALFADLPGKAGRQLRTWLAARRDPEVRVVEWFHTTGGPGYYRPKTTESRLLATVTPGLPQPVRHWYGYQEWAPMIECWPAALPAQRDVVAAHLAPHFARKLAAKGNDGPLLPMLAAADGPIGPGMRLALAYGMGAELAAYRAYAVDALLILAARAQLDGVPLGAQVGQLLERGDLAMNRVVPALRDTARSGAARPMWDLVAAALPLVWSHVRVADLLELAVELAHQVRPGGAVGGLAEVAARKGSSRTVKEAKRLVTALNG